MRVERIGLLALAVWLALVGPVAGKDRAARPNIVLILADDLGYSDIGPFGGEIRTPNLDRLAAGGLRLTQFYNGARCCPTRASLLTGLYAHQAGVGAMNDDTGRPGYRGHLVDECVTLAEVLRPAGYRTYLAGKWHLGQPSPIARGFDEAYTFRGGMTSFWDPASYFRLPEGRKARSYPPGQFYATDAITDHALDFLAESRQAAKPFFLYLAYNAPHFPLQAPEGEVAKYAERYKVGWDAIRTERHERMSRMGLLGPGSPLTPRSGYDGYHEEGPHGTNPAWDSLPETRHADLARRMAIFAAMVDRMDQNIGRVVEDLRKNGELDNTLILFFSDNGACSEWDPNGFDGKSGPENVLHEGPALATMGGPSSYLSYGSGWANAGTTPWRLYKHYTHEGGISTPFIAHWPAVVARKGEIDGRVAHIVDIMPTLIEVAGAMYPVRARGHDVSPPEGRSLLPALHGEPAEPRRLFFEHEGNRAVRDGRWKLVARKGRPWELYDIDADRSELHDLASAQPGRVAELVGLWDAWAKRCHVEP
jgi:arylsulfatase A-like enzyme